jgi:hypothetical protein
MQMLPYMQWPATFERVSEENSQIWYIPVTNRRKANLMDSDAFPIVDEGA